MSFAGVTERIMKLGALSLPPAIAAQMTAKADHGKEKSEREGTSQTDTITDSLTLCQQSLPPSVSPRSRCS